SRRERRGGSRGEDAPLRAGVRSLPCPGREFRRTRDPPAGGRRAATAAQADQYRCLPAAQGASHPFPEGTATEDSGLTGHPRILVGSSLGEETQPTAQIIERVPSGPWTNPPGFEHPGRASATICTALMVPIAVDHGNHIGGLGPG